MLEVWIWGKPNTACTLALLYMCVHDILTYWVASFCVLMRLMASPDTIIVNITVSALRSLEENGTCGHRIPWLPWLPWLPAGNFKRAVFCGVSSQSSHEFDAWEPQNWRWRIHGPKKHFVFLLPARAVLLRWTAVSFSLVFPLQTAIRLAVFW